MSSLKTTAAIALGAAVVGALAASKRPAPAPLTPAERALENARRLAAFRAKHGG